MSVAIVIPARFASTRLPGKPLLSETGWPLVRHAYEQAKRSKLASQVLIATDDARIASAIEGFGGDYVMTNPNHPTGTDRLAEAVGKRLTDAEIIINVQGDEPELEPAIIDRLITLYQAAGRPEMGTLVTRFSGPTAGPGSPADPNAVKAVLGAPVLKNGEVLGYEALYFSRSLMPYPRDANGAVDDVSRYFMHLGIYAYTPAYLQHYVAMPQGRLEQSEKLEQLRVMETGGRIVAGIIDCATPGIDTPADYEAFVKRWNEKH